VVKTNSGGFSRENRGSGRGRDGGARCGRLCRAAENDSPKVVRTIKVLRSDQPKAVLFEEDQSDPNGFQFAGSAVWRTEARWRVMPGSGQKPDVGVRADIEIPERKMSVRLWLQRNDDKQLPASHTIEVAFTLPADFAHGEIANVPGLLMKQRW
jgi:hypothetical protein